MQNQHQNLSSNNGVLQAPFYLLSNSDFIMSQQKQQSQQAIGYTTAPGIGFPNLPAQISSASSINSANYSVSSPQPCNASSSPVPAPAPPGRGGGTHGFGGIGRASVVQPRATLGMAAPASASGLVHASQLLVRPHQALSATVGLQQMQQQPILTNQLHSLAPHLAPANTTTTNPLLALGAFGTAQAAVALLPGGSVPEFLYQLTKMLTDDNRSIIEWSTYSGNGRIEVHHPGRLEKEVLGRYFRHSKYSSFQRQLNYFGFRKIAGKGKMSPCSYVNENATTDIRSLLLMKRKNSKEKERELAEQREKEQLQLQQNGGESRVANVGSGTKRRSNPGDDIQPATVRPMFTALSASAASAPVQAGVTAGETLSVGNNNTNEVFNSMAASIARNIDGPSSSTITAISAAGTNNNSLSNHPSVIGQNKRGKLPPQPFAANSSSSTLPTSSTTSAASSSNGRGYTVAIGKGVRHQLNGYLRPNTTTSTTDSNAPNHHNTSATVSTTITTTTRSSSSSYLSHPPSKLASSAPAPLQFLDPSELGMSIENSLSQLKDNFALAAAGGGDVSAAAMSSSAMSATTANFSSNNASYSSLESSTTCNNISSNVCASNQQVNNVKYAASALTRRVSSSAFFGGMLSRDDSLINLAMLPTLDTAATAMNNTGASNGGGSSSTNNEDYMRSIFSRDDSLVNLAASLENNNPSNTEEEDDDDGITGDGADDGSGNGDTFDFIDFQS